jgi:hypothetical protein
MGGRALGRRRGEVRKSTFFSSKHTNLVGHKRNQFRPEYDDPEDVRMAVCKSIFYRADLIHASQPMRQLAFLTRFMF